MAAVALDIEGDAVVELDTEVDTVGDVEEDTEVELDMDAVSDCINELDNAAVNDDGSVADFGTVHTVRIAVIDTVGFEAYIVDDGRSRNTASYNADHLFHLNCN